MSRPRAAAALFAHAPSVQEASVLVLGQPPTNGSPMLAAESRERVAALTRGAQRAAESANVLCAPNLPGLRAELLFTLVAENVRDYAIFVIDPDGIIRCWGEGARLMKWWTRQQAEGAHLRMLYPDGGSEDGTAEQHLEVAAEKGEYNGEGHRVRSDGSTFWAYVTLTALRNPDGALVGFSKVTRDFTARRAVEAALGAGAAAGRATEPPSADAMTRQQLMANISHELRAPLNALLGYATLLEADAGDPARQHAHLTRLKQSGRHLLEVVNGILELSRADAGAPGTSRSVHRLGPAIREALLTVEAEADARRIVLTDAVSGGPADLPYLGEPARVRQVVVNLLSNAIKFTEPGGHVTLSAGTAEHVASAALRGAGPWIYVRVEDTGRGIPAERLEAIFERYEQSDEADRHRGTGLGLSISRELARAMGGDLTVHSEVGIGSAFTLWLPMAQATPVPR